QLALSLSVTVGFSAGGHLALWVAARHWPSLGHIRRWRAPLQLLGAISLAGAVDLVRQSDVGHGLSPLVAPPGHLEFVGPNMLCGELRRNTTSGVLPTLPS